MKSEVYYTPVGSSHVDDSILKRLEKLFDRAGAGSIIKQDEIVAVKGHFGEPGNVTFISPVYFRTVVDRIKKCGGNPFLTDTNTLYAGERNNSVKHVNGAFRNGFSFATANAPLIISDGLLGTDFVEVDINRKHVKKAKIASGIYWADSMIVISHAKMHLAASLGAAIKNLGMGCASRAGKQEQHSGNYPAINAEKCIGCGECMDWCNFAALSMKSEKAVVDEKKCSGCGECIAVCRHEAISTRWDGAVNDLNEKMAEYAGAVLKVKKDKCFFLNFVINITPDCDCIPSSGKFIVPDIGILGSFDPVAIDKASADLINKAKAIRENLYERSSYEMKHADSDNFRLIYPELDWSRQLDYAQELGLGSKEYELIEI